jgi:uncharacterized protein
MYIKRIGGFVLVALLTMNAHAQATLLSAKNRSHSQNADICALPADYKPVETRYQSGIIFKIQDCHNTKPSYIMGTMHHDDPAFKPIVADASRLIAVTDSAGFEFVEDARSEAVALQYMLFLPTDPKGLRTLLGERDFKRLTAVIHIRAKIPEEVINRLRPWAAALLLQYPIPKADGVPLDTLLQKYARSEEKELYGLETPEEQYDVFASIKPEKQLVMLKDTLSELEEIDRSNKELINYYLARDLKKIQKLAVDSFVEIKDRELRAHMEEKLIRLRNVKMADRLKSRLDQGNTFIAVGALHLLGKEGVLKLLENQGYRISVVK